MKCQEIQELLSAYVDNTCTSIEKENIEKHISGCPSCKEELELLQSLVLSLNQLDDLELPSDFHQNLMDRIVILDQEKELTLELSPQKDYSSNQTSHSLLRKFNNWRVYTSFAAVFVFVLIFAAIGSDSLFQIRDMKVSETAATYDTTSTTMETTATNDTSSMTMESADTLNASAKMAAPETTAAPESASTDAVEPKALMTAQPTSEDSTMTIQMTEATTTSAIAVESNIMSDSITTTNVESEPNPLAAPFLTFGIIAFLLLVSRLIYLVIKNRT